MFNHTYLKRSLTAAVMAAAVAYPAGAQAAHIVQPELSTAHSASVPSVGPGLATTHQLNQLQGNVRQLYASEGGWPSATQSSLPSNFRTDASSGGYTSVATSAPSVSLPSAGSGFQWGDAGIGAAGALVLMGASGLGAVAMRRRRPERTFAS
jgi:hypothetical protein